MAKKKEEKDQSQAKKETESIPSPGELGGPEQQEKNKQEGGGGNYGG